jgi:SAM-dependent methyltransferase
VNLDFGYPWWLRYGHLALAALLGALAGLGLRLRWNRILLAFLAILAVWAFSAFLAVHFVVKFHGRATLPAAAFLATGRGRVLDIGAGTGRSAIMVLEARPEAHLVALDLFGASFREHFGEGQSPEAQLRANLRAAGVENRVTIQPGDMRNLPFPAASFDAAVSAYAMDHVNREGSEKALAEAARVVKPGGDFLLMLIAKDPWLQFTFGPLLIHSRTRGPDWWRAATARAGFDVLESGMQPATFYLLARRRAQ